MCVNVAYSQVGGVWLALKLGQEFHVILGCWGHEASLNRMCWCVVHWNCISGSIVFPNNFKCRILVGLPPSQRREERERPEEEEAGVFWLHPAILRFPQWRAPSGHVQTGTREPLLLAAAACCCSSLLQLAFVWFWTLFVFFLSPLPFSFFPKQQSFPRGEGRNERGSSLGVTNVFPQHKSRTQAFLDACVYVSVSVSVSRQGSTPTTGLLKAIPSVSVHLSSPSSHLLAFCLSVLSVCPC